MTSTSGENVHFCARFLHASSAVRSRDFACLREVWCKMYLHAQSQPKSSQAACRQRGSSSQFFEPLHFISMSSRRACGWKKYTVTVKVHQVGFVLTWRSDHVIFRWLDLQWDLIFRLDTHDCFVVWWLWLRRYIFRSINYNCKRINFFGQLTFVSLFTLSLLFCFSCNELIW